MDWSEKKKRLLAVKDGEEFETVMREILDESFMQKPEFKKYREEEVTLEEFLDEVFGQENDDNADVE